LPASTSQPAIVVAQHRGHHNALACSEVKRPLQTRRRTRRRDHFIHPFIGDTMSKKPIDEFDAIESCQYQMCKPVKPAEPYVAPPDQKPTDYIDGYNKGTPIGKSIEGQLPDGQSKTAGV
jgi:hypothetical protein